MKKRIVSFILLLGILFSLCSCTGSSNSTFSIQFIDVGQGDAALVECDGHYMLIDGGDVAAGDRVYDVLKERDVKELDILVASHLHQDHIGGLPKALGYVREIDLTWSNSTYSDKDFFADFNYALQSKDSSITVPSVDETCTLGSAEVKVIDVSDKESNDSLVLLITYGDTRFLFTGDIERSGQLRVIKKMEEKKNKSFDGLSLIKMPHHGAYNDKYGLAENALYRLLSEYNPHYFVISVGKGNQYNHPHKETLKLMEDYVIRAKELNWSSHVFRTDEDGDIIVKSNGKELSIESSK